MKFETGAAGHSSTRTPRGVRVSSHRERRAMPINIVRRCVRSSMTRALLRPVQREYVPEIGRRFFADETGGKNDEAMRGLPESRMPIVEDQTIPATEEEFARRRAAALRHWMENELGKERAALTALLAKHGVKIQGGSDEAKAFVEELIEWKADGVVSGIGQGEEK